MDPWSDLPPNAVRATVAAVSSPTPLMRRITFAGPELRRCAPAPGAWGPYLKLLMPRPGGPPMRRTYSLRAYDPDHLELTVDVLMHEPLGLASRWARDAGPGDRLGLVGCGAVPVAPEPGWILLAGDHSALPAIAYTLERLPPSARGMAIIAVADPAERTPLDAPPGVPVRWLDAADDLPAAVAATPWPARGPAVLWAGAEAALARALRSFARQEQNLDQNRRPILNYWKRGSAEGAFGYAD